ncbi:MAG: phosphoenolpyruvate--protein phosphotransferase [Clostridiales bacterium]|nr:phosphoenolpyruvate--protein phosphotransferase [Clostridiales bacterium]
MTIRQKSAAFSYPRLGFSYDAGDGLDVIVDGQESIAYVAPDAEVASRLEAKRKQEHQQKARLKELHGKPSTTQDGRKIKLYAIIGSQADVGAVLQNDAEGIGLFRSEFLYLQSKDYPTEETLMSACKTAAETMAGKPVIIRTLDIGADKQVDYFKLPAEENPAMSLRAIRICLTRPEIFRTQLRALYRASAFGEIAIMFPMINSLWEVQEIKKLAMQGSHDVVFV